MTFAFSFSLFTWISCSTVSKRKGCLIFVRVIESPNSRWAPRKFAGSRSEQSCSCEWKLTVAYLDSWFPSQFSCTILTIQHQYCQCAQHSQPKICQSCLASRVSSYPSHINILLHDGYCSDSCYRWTRTTIYRRNYLQNCILFLGRTPSTNAIWHDQSKTFPLSF